jgi:hypothetical protein
MSAFAMMYFQDPALLEFQRRWEEEEEGAGNLQTIFGLMATPCDSQFRDVIDRVESRYFENAFVDFFRRLQRSKQLANYEFIYGKYLVAVDGSDYFSSDAISCPSCLRQASSKKTEKAIRYHHPAGTSGLSKKSHENQKPRILQTQNAAKAA